MDVRIALTAPPTGECVRAIEELRSILLREVKVTPVRSYSDPDAGTKDGGLTVGLTIAGLGLAALGVLISALSYWQTSRPKYSITVSRGDLRVTLDGLASEELKEVVAAMSRVKASDPIAVLLARVE